MIVRSTTSLPLPLYHEGMLLVKVRSDAGRSLMREAAPVPVAVGPRVRVRVPAVTVAGMPGGAGATRVRLPTFDREQTLETPRSHSGLSMLERWERGGLIKRVISIAGTSSELLGASPRRGLATMAMSVSEVGERPPGVHDGVSMVECQHGAEVGELQRALIDDPRVEFVSRVPVRYMMLPARAKKKSAAAAHFSSKPLLATKAAPEPNAMWNLRKIRWAEARARAGFRDADTVKVAVLDTGVDPRHPDLTGVVSEYTYLHADLPSVVGEKDLVGHGTHVSGTIAARINNDLGINGICSCSLRVKKIFNDTAEYFPSIGYFTYLVDPILYLRALGECLEQGVDVINLSIGGPGEPSPQERQTFDALLAGGTVVVAAMGNEREKGSPTSYPAAIPGVIAVGATTLDDSVAEFSNSGQHISLCAPGKGIWSTLPTYPGQSGFWAGVDGHGHAVEGKPIKRETNYDSWDGTSMATPHVTAAAALVTAHNGRIGPEKMKKELQSQCDPVPGMNGNAFSSDYGAGRLNLLRLLGG